MAGVALPDSALHDRVAAADPRRSSIENRPDGRFSGNFFE